jgi:general stress protein 26
MSEQCDGERIWEIIERVGVCMLTTQAAGRLRARPLEARPDRKAGLIFAVTDVHSAKQDEIEAAPDVGLVVIDAKAKAYLSITARACAMRDTAKIAQVWRKTDEVLVAGWTERSQCVPVADRAAERRIVGRTGEHRADRVRVCQGLVDGGRTEPRREPQGNGCDVSALQRVGTAWRTTSRPSAVLR